MVQIVPVCVRVLIMTTCKCLRTQKDTLFLRRLCFGGSDSVSKEADFGHQGTLRMCLLVCYVRSSFKKLSNIVISSPDVYILNIQNIALSQTQFYTSLTRLQGRQGSTGMELEVTQSSN